MSLSGFVFPTQNEKIKPLKFEIDNNLMDVFKAFDSNNLTFYPKIKRNNVVFSAAISWNYISLCLQKIKKINSNQFSEELY